jgi:hypothetical protein
MSCQPVPVHTQERVIRVQLGEQRLGGHAQNNKVLQQLPEPRHCLPLHLLQFRSGKLLPLLLHKLHLRLPALLNGAVRSWFVTLRPLRGPANTMRAQGPKPCPSNET